MTTLVSRGVVQLASVHLFTLTAWRLVRRGGASGRADVSDRWLSWRDLPSTRAVRGPTEPSHAHRVRLNRRPGPHRPLPAPQSRRRGAQ